MTMNSMAFKKLIFFALIALCDAHTWVERLMRIDASNGTMVGPPGYVRGMRPRSEPGFSDLDMQHLLPSNGIYAQRSDRMCRSSQSSVWMNYTETFPRLKARPGDYIALQYQENGHITLPQNAPRKKDSGTVWIYGTSQALPNETFIDIHKVWNMDQTGGDRRGKLLAIRPFDDTRCYQVNEGAISKNRQSLFPKTYLEPQGSDLWCQNDLRLPDDVSTSLYTLYWVWEWPDSPGKFLPMGKPEIYTSCMDIHLKGEANYTETSYKYGQDLNFASIETQLLD